MLNPNRVKALGGAAVAGLFLSASLTLSSIAPVVQAKPVSYAAFKPVYLAQANGQSHNQLFSNLGIVNTSQPQVANAKTNKQGQSASASAPAKTVAAAAIKSQSRAIKLKAGAKLQVASRSTGPAFDQGMLGYALGFKGTPYVFGGTTPQGFDCSGFTSYVFRKYGISLPRTSYAQFATGRRVARGNLVPGDLVFFTTYSAGASHVGIYIGGGQFVNAANGGVKVSSLSDGYYAKRYLGARRVK
ncbi:MAG TPA: NlpC/P60 family protein [Desulfobacteria bacterium]|nr:NlpC/P60 family protein [Desulfobacteria bacterium]